MGRLDLRDSIPAGTYVFRVVAPVEDITLPKGGKKYLVRTVANVDGSKKDFTWSEFPSRPVVHEFLRAMGFKELSDGVFDVPDPPLDWKREVVGKSMVAELYYEPNKDPTKQPWSRLKNIKAAEGDTIELDDEIKVSDIQTLPTVDEEPDL